MAIFEAEQGIAALVNKPLYTFYSSPICTVVHEDHMAGTAQCRSTFGTALQLDFDRPISSRLR
jgi:hypothetical protein